MISPSPWELNDAGDVVFASNGLPVAFKPVYSENNGDMALIVAAPALRDALKAMVEAEVDYMTINNLGDPEKQHNVKLARAALALVENATSAIEEYPDHGPTDPHETSGPGRGR